MFLKKMLLSGVVLFVFNYLSVVYSQIAEGVIHYEHRVDVHRTLPPDREDLRLMVPQYRTDNYILVFNKEARFYKPFVDENELQPIRGGGRGGGPRMRTPNLEVYTHIGNNETIYAHEFLGRNYLIEDSLSIAPWRLGNEYMDIAGHRCQMAWYIDTLTNEEITAWFTLGIQPFMGPDRFASLPGTILALDINNGERVWIARKIESRSLNRDEIRKPTRGERITRERYQNMVEEQRQRMRTGGPGRF